MRRYSNNGDYKCHGWINWYCPDCHAFGDSAHAAGCTTEMVEISPTARIPRKNASKKEWKKFHEKFVLQVDLKETLEERKREAEKKKRKEGTEDKLRLKRIRNR